MIKIGNCPDSWGVWFDHNDKQMDWRRFTKEFHEAGYKYTEIGPYGYMSTDAAELKDEFAKWDIVPVGGNIMFNIEEDSEMPVAIEKTKKVCKLLKDIGAEYYIIMDGMYDNLLTAVRELPPTIDDDKFKALIKNLVTLSRVAIDMGITPVFHPHAGTHVEDEDQIDRVLDATSPDDVMLCFDTGHHIYRKGNDVYRFIETHGDRISFLHLKDLVESVKLDVWENDYTFPIATQKGIWADIGKGQIDWPKLKKSLDKVNFSGYAIIEQDCYPANYDEPLPIQKEIGKYLLSIGFGTLD
ncbi:MAG: sugar phosphate isomerase/epimerase family protein [Christensenellaceae bacterium]|jgi:inosose dehydratase